MQTMTETERNNAIVTTMELNEQVRELEQTVAQFRETSGDQKEITADLSRVADSLAFELRDSILELVRQNLGPEQQDNLMLVLRKAGEWLAAERAELQPRKDFLGQRVVSSPKDARRLRDLDFFEEFLHALARDILRAMADFNFQKSRTQCGP